ncbi:MAG: PAS domain-containing protein [Rhodothermus sp.]|nr:PAS domain-containing protein [Rhodothermus sp.]
MKVAVSTPARKRFQREPGLNPQLPLLLLNAEGDIQHITPAARTLLEYSETQPLDSCFFTYVHSRNLQQVWHDLAAMARARKQQASWLLRLRTGRGHWRWFQVRVRNLLPEKKGMLLLLQPLQQA